MRRLTARLAPLLLIAACIPACGPAGDTTGGAADRAAAGGEALRADSPLIPFLVVAGEPLPPEESRTLAARMEALGVPGVSIAVLRDGAIAWAAGYGMADVEEGRPVTAETLFQAASISKPVAATGMLAIATELGIELDEDVNLRLRSWKVPENELTHPPGGPVRPVTLRGLLSHTAGLTVHGFPGYPRDAAIPTTVDVLDGKGNTDPVRVDIPPGTRHRYSGGGYTVAQLWAVDVAGTDATFPKLMEAKVLRPLGMDDSTFRQPLPEREHARAATGYRSTGEPVEGKWHVYPEMAAAGLWTTPSDLARFALGLQRALAGDSAAGAAAGPTVLDRATAEAMLTAPIPPEGDDPDDRGYGLGLGLSADRFGHGGANEGFRCTLTAFREGGNGAVVMTNSDSGMPLAREILITLFDRYGWKGETPIEKTVVEVDLETLRRYAGRYAIEGYGEFEIAVADSGDRLRFSLPDGSEGELRAQSPTAFFDPNDGGVLEFVVEEGGGPAVALTGRGFRARRVD